mgnify:CR=1 FL=1
MKKIIILVTSIWLVGCAYLGPPLNIDGNYYYVLEKDCAHFRYAEKHQPNAPQIDCYSSEGEYKDTISGGTPDQLREARQLGAALVSAYNIREASKARAKASARGYSLGGYTPMKIPTYGGFPSRVSGTRMYSHNECIGSVVSGICYGKVNPSPGPSKKCFGAVSLGECHGAVIGN